MNIYVGVPESFADVLLEAQGQALAAQIRAASKYLHDGNGGKYAEVIRLLLGGFGEIEPNREVER